MLCSIKTFKRGLIYSVTARILTYKSFKTKTLEYKALKVKCVVMCCCANPYSCDFLVTSLYILTIAVIDQQYSLTHIAPGFYRHQNINYSNFKVCLHIYSQGNSAYPKLLGRA